MTRASAAPRLSSFDLFDTLVTRLVARPIDLFLVLALRARRLGLSTAEPRGFQAARVDAEARARRKTRADEVTLEEIYQELATALGLSGAVVAQLASLETALEVELTVPIASTVRLLERLRDAGDQIAVVTDTYLPEPTIRQILERCGIRYDHLFVSSSLGKSKAEGSMQRHLVEFAKRSGLRFVSHRGDNLESDVDLFHRGGLRAERLWPARPTEHEEALAQEKGDLFGSTLAGVSRALRLSTHGRDASEETLVAIVGSIVAPTLVSYVLWVLRSAEERRCERLFFLARDGQILLRIANVLNHEGRFFSGTLHYAHASRQAWNLPAAWRDPTNITAWVTDDSQRLSWESIAMRLSFDEASRKTVLQALTAAGFDTSDPTRRPADAEFEKLFAAVGREGDPLRATVQTVATEARERVLEYLRRQGMLGTQRFGIVDIGWRGRLQRALIHIIGDTTPVVHGHYLGLDSPPTVDVAPGVEKPTWNAFFDSWPEVRRAVNANILEIWTAADHGTTLGYKDGAAVLATERRPETNLHLIARLQDLCEAYARQGAALWPELSVGSIPAACKRTLTLAIRSPSRAVAEVFGDFLHTDDQCESYLMPLAPALVVSLQTVKDCLRGKAPGRTFWIEGSLARSGPASRALVNVCRAIHPAAKTMYLAARRLRA